MPICSIRPGARPLFMGAGENAECGQLTPSLLHTLLTLDHQSHFDRHLWLLGLEFGANHLDLGSAMPPRTSCFP